MPNSVFLMFGKFTETDEDRQTETDRQRQIETDIDQHQKSIQTETDELGVDLIDRFLRFSFSLFFLC